MRDVRIGFYQSCVLQWIIGAVAAFSAAMILSVDWRISWIISFSVATCDAVIWNFLLIMFLYPYYAYDKLDGNISENMRKRMFLGFPKRMGVFDEKDSLWHNICVFVITYVIVGFCLYYFELANICASIFAGAIITGYWEYINFKTIYILKLYHSHRLKKIS